MSQRVQTALFIISAAVSGIVLVRMGMIITGMRSPNHVAFDRTHMIGLSAGYCLIYFWKPGKANFSIYTDRQELSITKFLSACAGISILFELGLAGSNDMLSAASALLLIIQSGIILLNLFIIYEAKIWGKGAGVLIMCPIFSGIFLLGW